MMFFSILTTCSSSFFGLAIKEKKANPHPALSRSRERGK
jgi:hypothetical protein